MKQTKNLLAWLLMLAAMPVFVACGDDDEDSEEKPITEQTEGSNSSDNSSNNGNSDGTSDNGSAGNTGHAPAGVEAIDLGMPSGTKWANMNVGASLPEDYGGYFAWGETSPKSYYYWETYKWMNSGQNSGYQINKYQVADNETSGCWYRNGTFIGDNKTTLDLSDDAAYVNWGRNWRMPTYDEFEEMLNNTTSTWTTLNGVYGMKFTSKTNGNTLFLPAAGDFYGRSVGRGTYGYYWSSTLDPSFSDYAWYLYFYSGSAVASSDYRYYGRSVRPVLRN